MSFQTQAKHLFQQYIFPQNRCEKLFLVYAVAFTIIPTVIVLATIKIGPQILLLFSCWFILAQIAIKSETNQTKSNKNSLIVLYTLAILYPYIEIFIKYFIHLNIIPYSYNWVNRIEHGLFSAAITYFIYFPTRELLRASNSDLLTALSTIAYVNILGIFNEFLEYFIRVYNHMPLAKYYSDTIKDLLVNFIFSAIAAILLLIFKKHGRSTQNNK